MKKINFVFFLAFGVVARLNDLLAALRTHGLIAT